MRLIEKQTLQDSIEALMEAGYDVKVETSVGSVYSTTHSVEELVNWGTEQDACWLYTWPGNYWAHYDWTDRDPLQDCSLDIEELLAT